VHVLVRPKALALVAALGITAAGFAAVVATPAAQAAVPATIPLQLTNNSGRGDPVFVYDLGTLLSTGQQGWADANGTFHAWPAGGNPPTPAPDASIAGPATGHSITIRIPQFSGRLYFSYGQKIVFKLTTGGLVQPAVQNPSDPNENILFDWSEYTLNSSGLFINSTDVDFFAIPYAVGVKNSAGATQTTGHLKAGGYNAVLNSLTAQPGGWGNLIQKAPDGTVVRALAPAHGIETGRLSSTILSDYVNRVWAKYATSTLTVTPFANQPNTQYFGRVSGNVMNFTNSAGQVVTSFQKPDSSSIFNCAGLLDAPNDLVRGPISRTLCAGYNRATLLTDANQPDDNAADFYKDTVSNQYSRKIHEQMADGRAYGFAFDDVGNFESLVQDPNPTEAFVTLDPLS
jgi:glycosyl hydrolase family 64 (putative beta-1,3-glucanase)